jgi:hypothetical protein
MRVVVADGNVIFAGPLATGSVAYVDADQLPEEGEAVIEALVVPDGAPADDGSLCALCLLAAPVRDALAGVEGVVDVVGAGAVAWLIRTDLGSHRLAEDAPAAVVDLTGNPDVIIDAVRRVADLGTIVLAGDPAGRVVDFDFYPDVHVRGLRLVGVRPADRAEPLAGPVSEGERPEAPEEARVGQDARAGAAWYRVSS